MEALTSKTYFESVSGDWDEMGNSFFGEAPRKAILEKLVLRDGAVVADVGCGTGYLTAGLDLSNIYVKAIDQSKRMLEVMRDKFNAHPSISYLTGHSEDLPLETGEVDAVIANMYLHHVENPDRAIAEMVRTLKPGGRLVFTDLDKHDFRFLVKEQHDRWMGFERKVIQSWMEEAGLQGVEIDCVGANCCANSDRGTDRAEIGIFIASGTKPV